MTKNRGVKMKNEKDRKGCEILIREIEKMLPEASYEKLICIYTLMLKLKS